MAFTGPLQPHFNPKEQQVRAPEPGPGHYENYVPTKPKGIGIFNRSKRVSMLVKTKDTDNVDFISPDTTLHVQRKLTMAGKFAMESKTENSRHLSAALSHRATSNYTNSVDYCDPALPGVANGKLVPRTPRCTFPTTSRAQRESSFISNAYLKCRPNTLTKDIDYPSNVDRQKPKTGKFGTAHRDAQRNTYWAENNARCTPTLLTSNIDYLPQVNRRGKGIAFSKAPKASRAMYLGNALQTINKNHDTKLVDYPKHSSCIGPKIPINVKSVPKVGFGTTMREHSTKLYSPRYL